MDPVSTLCVLIGSLIIATRAPMIFAPSATLRVFEKILANDHRIRGLGVLIGALALALVALPRGEGAAVEILRALGWIWLAGTVWLLAAPGSYRRFARGVLGFFEHSVDQAIVRLIGLVAATIGVAIVYYGIYVV